MSDLVERLRRRKPGIQITATMEEAADEIERLRAANEAAKNYIEQAPSPEDDMDGWDYWYEEWVKAKTALREDEDE